MHAHWCWRANRSIVNSKWFFKSFHTSSKRDRERWTVRVKKNIGKRSEYGRLMYMYNKLLLIIFCPNSSLFLYTHTIVCMPEYICIALVSGCCWLTPISEAASKYTSIDESSQNNCVYCSIESILLQKEAEIETEQETVISCIAMPMKLWLYRNFEMHVHCTCLRFHIRSAEYLRACWFDLTTNKQVY